jgi:hypothetical protein
MNPFFAESEIADSSPDIHLSNGAIPETIPLSKVAKDFATFVSLIGDFSFGKAFCVFRSIRTAISGNPTA